VSSPQPQEVYGPEQDNAEWSEDNLGLVWSVGQAATHHFPVSVEFTYGEVPADFVQRDLPSKNSTS
jgi:hypothetical protein